MMHKILLPKRLTIRLQQCANAIIVIGSIIDYQRCQNLDQKCQIVGKIFQIDQYRSQALDEFFSCIRISAENYFLNSCDSQRRSTRLNIYLTEKNAMRAAFCKFHIQGVP